MKLYVQHTRPLSAVPKTIIIILLVSFFLQCAWHFSLSHTEVKRQKLADPPAKEVIELVSLSDPVTAAKIVMLWLQAFDNQPGVSIPLKELNYEQVTKWLNLILGLDNKTQYPLLAAIRFYAGVQNEEKQRLMIEYVTKKFLEDPNERWSVMAHAAYIAKHRVKDMQLALKCAQLLRLNAKGDNVLHWAKQMEFFVLEDMGELESAKVLIGGLLDSGELEDPHQRRFLGQRLKEIEDRLALESSREN